MLERIMNMATAKQIEKGKWRIDVYKNGMRRTFRGKSSRAVEKMAREWLNDIEEYGKELRKDKVKLHSLMLEHLLVNVKDSVSLGTFERYMSIYNTHFKDSLFGDMDIKNITQVQTQKFLNDKKNLSPKSLNLIVILLNNTFKHAIANNLIRNNIINDVKIPKSTYKEKKIEVFTREEQKLYLEAASNSFYNLLFITALSTGMRVGEITALKWKNIDLNKNIIHVTNSTRLVMKYDEDGNMIENELVTGDTKTKSGRRDIPISVSLSTSLKKYKLSTGSNDKDYVFKNTKREQIKYDSIAKAHKLICKKAGIRIVTFHCLRHTFATRAIESGIDYKTVSEILGHSKPSTTINLYVHSTNDSKREAAELISELINELSIL
jgi:integrase